MFTCILGFSIISVLASVLALEHPATATVSDVTTESCSIEQNASIVGTVSDRANAAEVSDGDLRTRWTVTASTPSSLEIDLGKQENVCLIDMHWYNGQKSIPVKIMASSFLDTGFKEIFSGKTVKITVGFNRIYFHDLEARFLKITFVGVAKSLGGIAEIQVYTPYLPLYDNFENKSKTNDKWAVIYTGHGFAGAKVEKGDGNVYQISPKTSKSKKETHASLVVSKQNFSNFKLVADVRTDGQLRKNGPPNSWEVGWLFFRYTDTFHYYWFTLKPNGIELGKKDCNNCVNPVDGQIILFTGTGPRLKIGEWSKWTVETVNNHIMISVDGNRVIDFTDDSMSKDLSRGQVAMYSEDAKVSFDNFYLVQY